MLSPHDRASLFEALRPPPGFVLDHAAGTSFTLDLEALLTAPIAFALFDTAEADTDEAGVEPVGLLEAIRRHTEHITVFSQAGHISVPARHRSVFAWLEESIVAVTAPTRHRLFHPKIWVARYVNDTGAMQLRVLCATRNLTFDTSWDTLLRLDSDTYQERPTTVIPGQAALHDLLLKLPDLAIDTVAPRRKAALASLAADVAAVRLAPPEPFSRLEFHIFGLNPTPPPWPNAASEVAVVSPFLGNGFLQKLTDQFDVTAVVSRQESLDRITPEVRSRIERLAVLHSAADVPTEITEGTDPDRGGQAPFGGLHAKLYVFDTPDGALVLTGSANATDAAFGGNVEALVALHGPRSSGVASLLGGTPGEVGFDDLVMDYIEPDEAPEPDPQAELDVHLGNYRRALAELKLTARVEPDGDDYTLVVTTATPIPPLSDVDNVTVDLWPSSLGDQVAAQLVAGEPVAVSFPVSLAGLTSFFAVRVTAERDGVSASATFLVTACLQNEPEDRRSRLLAEMLRDADRLLRYLLLLLWDPDALLGDSGGSGSAAWTHRFASGGWEDIPLLELLVRAADRHPARLDHIAGLIRDLGDHAGEVLPDGFAELWEPVMAYRNRQAI